MYFSKSRNSRSQLRSAYANNKVATERQAGVDCCISRLPRLGLRMIGTERRGRRIGRMLSSQCGKK